MRKREEAGRVQEPEGGVSPAIVEVFAEAIRVAIPEPCERAEEAAEGDEGGRG